MQKQKGFIREGVITIVIVAVLVLIGGLTYGYVRDALTTPMANLNNTDYNATVTTIDANTWAGLSLSSVAIIVLAAVLIISVVLLLGRAK